jgi:hypothetical protein
MNNMEDATVWVDIFQNISNNGKRILSNHGKTSNTSIDCLDKTIHGSSSRLNMLTQNTNTIIKRDWLSDISNHAKFIVEHYERNTNQCNIFFIFVFFVSIFSVSVKEFYDW